MFHRYDGGWIELVCGSMFSGKTEELIRRLVRADIAKQKVQVFKPEIDKRYSANKVSSHSGSRHKAAVVKSVEEMAAMIEDDTNVIGIDEVQFFDPDVVYVCETLADQGKRVICAGLDTDFRGVPFGPMPDLMARAEEVNKLHAICVVCGEDASRTQRLINGRPAAFDDPVVLVGAAEVYEARCRQHHEVLGVPEGDPKGG